MSVKLCECVRMYGREGGGLRYVGLRYVWEDGKGVVSTWGVFQILMYAPFC